MIADVRLVAQPAAGRRVPLGLEDPARSDAGTVPAAVPLAGQLMSVPPGRYDWLYLLLDRAEPADGAAVAPGGPGVDTVWLYYDDAVDPETLSLPARRGTRRVPVTRRATLTGVRLPNVPTVRIMTATLVTTATEEQP